MPADTPNPIPPSAKPANADCAGIPECADSDTQPEPHHATPTTEQPQISGTASGRSTDYARDGNSNPPVISSVNPEKRGWRSWAGMAAALLAAAAALYAHRETVDYALCAFDTYPQIISARIYTWNDFVGSFTEVLTDGRIEARFFRPVQNLTIAFDYWVSGLEPLGYHVNTLIWLALTIIMLCLAARRILGVNTWVGPLVGGLLVALHPVLLNFVPTPCRRSELLISLFLLALLWIAPQSVDRRIGWRLAATGLLTWLAAGSKDLGVMGLGLIFIHQLFLRPASGFFRTLGRAILSSIPALLGAAIYLLNRTWTLGGLGGYDLRGDTRTFMERTNDLARSLISDIFAPLVPFHATGFLTDWSREDVGVLLATVFLVIALGGLAFCVAADRSERRRAGVIIVLGLAYAAPPFVVLGLLRFYGPWYAGLPLVAVALVLAGLVELACSLLRGRWFERAFGGVYGTLAGVVLVMAVWYSPAWVFYPDWHRASTIVSQTLDRLERAIAHSRPGATIELAPPPQYTPERNSGRVRLGWVATIQVKGVQAYVDMRYPNLAVRVCYGHAADCWRPRQGEILVRMRYMGMNE